MNENREVIIPDISGVLRFLADGINSIPDDNNIVRGMEVVSTRYPIAKGRIQGIPLKDLIKNTEIQIVEKEKDVMPNTLKKSRSVYDDLGLNIKKEMKKI